MFRTTQPPVARVLRRSLVALLAMVAALVLLGGPTVAGSSVPEAVTESSEVAQADESFENQVRILQVSGLLDPVLHDFILRELTAAEEAGILGVLLQYDSRGSVLDDEKFIELATRFRDSPIEIGIWVGPSGSAALGGSAELLGTVDLVGVVPGSRIGETGPLRLPETFAPPFGAASERLETVSISAGEALDLGITNVDENLQCSTTECKLESISVVRGFVAQFDGYQSPADTSDEAVLSQTWFAQLPLTGQLFHTAASPEVAYLMFIGGLALLVFELYTAGVGLAGSIGAFCIVFGCYGLTFLPTRPWALAALVLSMLAFAVDIQTNLPRLYTAVGMFLFICGTWFLYDGMRMSWVTMLFGVVGAALYAYTGMPSMVRTRFSSPTIGRSWMVGELGEAITDVSPEGTVRIKDAPWRALTNRATPLQAGDTVRVVGLNRMVLEVEPEEGGARDYRERG